MTDDWDKRWKRLDLSKIGESKWDDRAYRRGYRTGFCHAVDDFLWLLYRWGGGFCRPTEVANILYAHYEIALRKQWCRETPADDMVPPPRVTRVSWESLRRQVFKRDGEVCAFCWSTEDLEIDHIIPVSEGGIPSLDNLRVLCRKCNSGRNGDDK